MDQGSALRILLEDVNRTAHGTYYVGERGRLAGATGVKFIDPRRLLISSLIGRCLYLVHIDWPARSHRVGSSFLTHSPTDLLDFDGKHSILTSNCEDRSVSLYRLDGDEIRHEKKVPILADGAGFCHGARFVPGTDVLCATCITEKCSLYFISRTSHAMIYEVPRHGTWKPKDICFVAPSLMIVVYTGGAITTSPSASYMSKVSLVEFDLVGKRHRLLNEVTFEGHVDSCVHHAGNIYVNDQMRDKIVCYRLEGDVLRLEHELSGYSFPHGLDILPVEDGDLLAVTNYGDNTVYIEHRCPSRSR